MHLQFVPCRAILCQGKQEMNALFGLSELKARKFAASYISLQQVSDSHSMPPLLTFDADPLEDAVERSVKRVEVLQRQATSKAYNPMSSIFPFLPFQCWLKHVEATRVYISAD